MTLIREDIVHFITDNFVRQNYTDASYYDQVMEREKLGSTAFGNIAIPHTLKMTAKKTGIFIFLSKRGIQWNDKKVNIIIALAINIEDGSHFKDIYENITLFLSEYENVQKSINCKNYKDFINTLVSFNIGSTYY